MTSALHTQANCLASVIDELTVPPVRVEVRPNDERLLAIINLDRPLKTFEQAYLDRAERDADAAVAAARRSAGK